MWQRHRHRIIVGLLWVAVVVGYQLWAWRSGTGPGESARRLVETLQDNAWGPLIFTGLYLVRPLLLFSAAVLTVAGGFLFGPWLGIAVVIVAANASAMVAFTIGRWFGVGSSEVESEGSQLKRFAGRLRQRGFETILIMRLVLLPYDLVSYMAGLLRVKPMTFLAGTALGALPGTVAFVLAGASITTFDGGLPEIEPITLIASLAILVVSLVLARLVRRREVEAE